MKKLLILLIWATHSFAGDLATDFERELNEMNRSLSQSAGDYSSLKLTNEDKLKIKKLDELQTLYYGLYNKYLSQYPEQSTASSFSFTKREISQIHYDLTEKTVQFLKKRSPEAFSEINHLDFMKQVKEQSLIFSSDLAKIEETGKSTINFKSLFEKFKFKLNNSPMYGKGLRVNIKSNGRAVALTFLVSFAANYIIPGTFYVMGKKKLAWTLYGAIQPVLNQVIVSAFFNIKNKMNMKNFLGAKRYTGFKRFIKDLYKDKPQIKSIMLLLDDEVISFRYRSRINFKGILNNVLGKDSLNFSQVKSYCKKNGVFLDLISQLESKDISDFDKNKYFLESILNLESKPEVKKFLLDFDYTFSRHKNFIADHNLVSSWFFDILNISDFKSFNKALRSVPPGTPTHVYFEVLEKKILPIFAEFKGVKYKDFTALRKNLYLKKFKLLDNGVKVLGNSEIDQLAKVILKEATASQGCPTWLQRTLPQFRFLRGVVF